MSLLLFLALVTAIAAGIRGAWSPCGLSMLSTITPLAEAGRGHRFRWTASWFVVGAVVGGLTTGAGAAVLAAAVGLAGLPVAATLGLAALAAVVTAGSDLQVIGRQLPIRPRQVNEEWLGRYRSWVYGAGFGWQIGTGFATYIMTAAVYLTVALAAISGSPLAAVVIGATFGLVRGLAILPAATITTPARLVAAHRRFDAWAEPVRQSVIGVQLAVALAAVVGLVSTLAAVVALLAVAAVTAAVVRGRSQTLAPSPAVG